MSDPTFASLENAISQSRSAQKKKGRVTVLMIASILLGTVVVVSLAFTYPSELRGIGALAVGANPDPPLAYFDSEKPEIKISSPSNNVTFVAPPSGVEITIGGEARDDGTGIQKVEVRFMTATSKTSYQMATPSSSQDWSTWTIERTLSVPGTYEISARAIDNAGNEQWTTIQLDVSIGTPESADNKPVV